MAGPGSATRGAPSRPAIDCRGAPRPTIAPPPDRGRRRRARSALPGGPASPRHGTSRDRARRERRRAAARDAWAVRRRRFARLRGTSGARGDPLVAGSALAPQRSSLVGPAGLRPRAAARHATAARVERPLAAGRVAPADPPPAASRDEVALRPGDHTRPDPVRPGGLGEPGPGRTHLRHHVVPGARHTDADGSDPGGAAWSRTTGCPAHAPTDRGATPAWSSPPAAASSAGSRP